MNLLVGLVVGGVLLALVEMQHQGISASAALRVGQSTVPPAPYPQYAGQTQVGASMVDQIDKGALQGVSIAGNALKNISSVIPIIGSVVAAIGGQLLAAHTARIAHAKSENVAVANLMPRWQADFVDIVQKYNGGAVTRAQAMAGVRKLDQQTKGYLKSHVGASGPVGTQSLSGTAWSGKPTGCPGADVSHSACLDGGADGSCGGPHPCNRQCTVGCCVYYNYLEPAMDCLYKRLARGGVQGVGVPAIPGNKYGFPNYPAFAVQIVPPGGR